MTPWYLSLLGAFIVVSIPAHALAQPPDISAASVLTGCWKGGMGEVEMSEQWSDARGGVLLGATRYFRDGVLVDFEFARIEETDSAVVLWPYPGGERSPRGFALVATDPELVFENLEHDFPVRIIYREVEPGHLAPRIEGRDGDGRGWELIREACPG